jgi:prepilin-type N-terminal cleavage/methylation domain-containing protein
MTARRISGFTLIEMMIVTAITALVTIAIVSYMSTMNDVVSGETIQGAAEVNANRVVSDFAQDLTDACVISPTPLPFESYFVWFKKPISPYISADAVVLGVNAPWSGPGGQDGYYAFFFRATEYLYESSIGDINHDGDRIDVFARGKLVRRWHTTSGNQERDEDFLDNVVQVYQGGAKVWSGDITGDGADDPVFTMTADKILTISIWLYTIDVSGRPLLVHGTTRVVPRNQS